MSRQLRASHALLLSAVLTAGCVEEPFEPMQASDYRFSIYGFLDASADTQWVRVASVRTSVVTPPEPPGAVVTLEHLGTGEFTTLHDSVFLYPSATLEGDLYARNFWTDVPMEQGGEYRLTATRSDGASATVSAVVPEDADTLVVGILQGIWWGWGGPPLYRDYLRLVGPEYLAIVQVAPAPACPEFIHVAGGPDARADENGELRVDIFRILACPDPNGPATQPIWEWDLRIAISGSPWPYDPEWSDATAFRPDVSLGMAGGVGFLGGVLTRTVPYETCYVIGADYGEYCELAYLDPPTGVTGVVSARVETHDACEPVPRDSATVFLWENDRPEVERTVVVEDIRGAEIMLRAPDGVKVRTAFSRPDGRYRIGALLPGMRYRVAVIRKGVVHVESVDLVPEPGQTIVRDIELPGTCS